MFSLQLHDIQYEYNKSKKILRGVHAKFESGKLYAIVGPSGCGKSTLLSLLGGLDCATGGQVLYNGQDIEKIGLATYRKNHVAFVFQNYNLIDYMTPKENVALASKLPSMPLFMKLGLTKAEIKRNVLQLSGGQQQRVAIARALASNAEILLADEPTGNLDEDTAIEIVEILKESAHESGKCVIVVTHSNTLAKQADKVFRLKKGLLY